MQEENRINFHQRYLPFIGSHKEIYINVDDHPQVTIIRQNLIFYNIPPQMIIRICLIKTLLEKTLWEKTLVNEKEYNILLDYYNYLVKNLASKTQWDKTQTKEKKSAVYPYYHSPPHVNMIMIFSTFHMVDLSIFAFQCHTLTFSMWSKITPL